MIICLERGAGLHMAWLMPLPLTVSCFGKSILVFPFWYRLNRVVPYKGPFQRCCLLGALQSTVFQAIITSAEEGGYVFSSVCLSVCLSVGLLANL